MAANELLRIADGGRLAKSLKSTGDIYVFDAGNIKRYNGSGTLQATSSDAGFTGGNLRFVLNVNAGELIANAGGLITRYNWTTLSSIGQIAPGWVIRFMDVLGTAKGALGAGAIWVVESATNQAHDVSIKGLSSSGSSVFNVAVARGTASHQTTEFIGTVNKDTGNLIFGLSRNEAGIGWVSYWVEVASADGAITLHNGQEAAWAVTNSYDMVYANGFIYMTQKSGGILKSTNGADWEVVVASHGLAKPTISYNENDNTICVIDAVSGVAKVYDGLTGEYIATGTLLITMTKTEWATPTAVCNMKAIDYYSAGQYLCFDDEDDADNTNDDPVKFDFDFYGRMYVGKSGSNTAPYETKAKAANELSTVLAFIRDNADTAWEVEVLDSENYLEYKGAGSNYNGEIYSAAGQSPTIDDIWLEDTSKTGSFSFTGRDGYPIKVGGTIKIYNNSAGHYFEFLRKLSSGSIFAALGNCQGADIKHCFVAGSIAFNIATPGTYNIEFVTIPTGTRGVYVTHAGAVVNVKNSVITYCSASGLKATAGTINSSFNNVYGNFNNKGNYEGCSPGEGDVSVKPYYKDLTPVAIADRDYTILPVSVCIDGGDPSSPYSNEPAPNGSRANMGAFGNTSQAELSVRDAWFEYYFSLMNFLAGV